jgi:hypothetical protein
MEKCEAICGKKVIAYCSNGNSYKGTIECISGNLAKVKLLNHNFRWFYLESIIDICRYCKSSYKNIPIASEC